MAPATSDFDGDGDVDGTDLGLWNGGFGKVGDGTSADGDANADGNVDGSDFLIWQRQLGFDLTPSGAAAVPEPAGMSLVLLAAIAGYVGRPRWRR